MHILAKAAGKPTRASRLDMFSGGRYAQGGMVPGKISNAPLMKILFIRMGLINRTREWEEENRLWMYLNGY